MLSEVEALLTQTDALRGLDLESITQRQVTLMTIWHNMEAEKRRLEMTLAMRRAFYT